MHQKYNSYAIYNGQKPVLIAHNKTEQEIKMLEDQYNRDEALKFTLGKNMFSVLAIIRTPSSITIDDLFESYKMMFIDLIDDMMTGRVINESNMHKLNIASVIFRGISEKEMSEKMMLNN